ncbi:MAG: hypothetical protein ABW141_17645 [Candidatus Thiodiazotropha endolucinida]
MDGDDLPDTDRVARLVKGTQILDDGSIDGAAFSLREGEPYVSVEWIEHLGCQNENDEIKELQSIFSSFNLRKL